MPAPPVVAVEAHRLIRAPADHIFNHLVPPDQMARYGAPLWMVADAAEKRGGHLVALRGYFIGLPAESLLRVTLRAPSSLEFVQVLGTVRAFSGRCTLRSVEDGVEVTYRLEMDPGIPMVSDGAARQFLVQFLERMLDRVKLASERKSPNRRAAAKTASVSTALPGEAVPGDAEASDSAEPSREAPEIRNAAREIESAGERSPGAVTRPARPHPARRPAARGRAERVPGTDAGVAQTPEMGPGQAAVTQTAGATGAAAPSTRKRRRRRRGRRPGTTGAAPPEHPQR